MKVVKRNTGWFPSIFDEFFTDNRLDVPNYENFSIPAVNIQENLTNFVIELAVPGLEKENIAIEVEENVLKVSSEVTSKTETEDTDRKFTRKEFSYNNFSRSFTLPETVDVENIVASYKDGVLMVTIPKKEEQKALKKMVEIS
ncbi:MAG: Hsp20/alpha crystallin family protein [Bacteroidia bacterium]|nr:Hsp20/alpha crystallin family protein [Bacteroidia bacterium]NNF30202.1 Hsp20/alpha crystallin family protein [Flavobacteriaceae bacterium]MBT8275475.1 Hsp20/alpha crystallin family protein [Bacteroidia bacterium]NNJ81218.1 Hsp20/alpha crystallin family protein [Flavobacteriaceae bacterium]NNK54407.1 Hsp20/alpha crystallin family protein [Flavobacteriaceae bacterium]